MEKPDQENKGTNEGDGGEMGVINIEPRWQDIVFSLAEMYGTPENHDYVKGELLKIAKVADLVRQAQKKGLDEKPLKWLLEHSEEVLGE